MGIGTFTQINGITSAANSFFDPEKSHTILLFGNEYTITQIIVGIIITVLAALIILVGIQCIWLESDVGRCAWSNYGIHAKRDSDCIHSLDTIAIH